jgi:AcrR family transcriptional regulator
MEDRNTDDPILGAAKATVLDFGVRRATLTEVARRAGLSRMTVYRRYSDAPELMRALMSSEFGGVLAQAQAASEDLDSKLDRVVAAAIGTIELLMDHPLLLRLLELEPEAMLPYLTERIGVFQGVARESLAGWIAEAQVTGDVRSGDPDEMAQAIELASRGLVIAARTLEPAQRQIAVRELERMLESYLSA